MAKLLFVQASPRNDRSKSLAVATAFVASYRKRHPGDSIVALDLFKAVLPPFDGPALDAKYAILHGGQPTGEQTAAWKVVEGIIADFKSADKYVMAIPMWNFGIPYRLKQYIDILVQPGYTFSYDPQKGYSGMVTGKPMFIAYARGGEYADPDPVYDKQKSYMELILGFIGFTDIKSVIVQPTLTGTPEDVRKRVDAAVAQAVEIARDF